MARTVDAGSGSSLGVSVWWTMSLVMGANEVSPLRMDSSAPHCRLVMMSGSGTSLAAAGVPAGATVVLVVAVTPNRAVVDVVVWSGPPGSSMALAAARAGVWGSIRLVWVASMATMRRSRT